VAIAAKPYEAVLFVVAVLNVVKRWCVVVVVEERRKEPGS
jgi:hypothetical protein